MIAKTFELRDSATFIPVMAVRLDPGCEQDRYLLGRAGFGVTPERQGEYVLLLGLDSGEGKFDCDPHGWGQNRTRHFAHKYIIQNFDILPSGSVIDVEFILGETTEPKKSESETALV